MAEHQLLPRKVFNNNQFSWVFLLWYLVYGFATLLFLFYFNRLIAYLVSLVIRFYTWHYYRVHVHIRSLQVSPLAGRIFFKGVRYFGRNETILVQDGYLTWRYWYLRVRELDHELASGSTAPKPKPDAGANVDEGQGGLTSSRAAEQTPCRVSIKVRGVQWFVYNRTPVYDNLAQSMRDISDSQSSFSASTSRDGHGGLFGSEQARHRPRNKADSNPSKSKTHEKTSNVHASRHSSVSSSSISDQHVDVSEQQSLQLPSLLSILPVSVQCDQMAVVMGNQSTKSVLTAKAEKASGVFTAQASAPMDLYRQVIQFDLEHPTVYFKHNQEYQDVAPSLGEKLCSLHNDIVPERSSWFKKLNHSEKADPLGRFVKSLYRLQRGSLDQQQSHAGQQSGSGKVRHDGYAHGQDRWLGLARYLDDTDEVIEQERWRSIEYARVPCVVDCPSISMKYYWDIPGTVSPQPIRSSSTSERASLNINGCEAPAWGIDLRLWGGTVTYGPWADRQRVDMQRYFFPSLYKDVEPARELPLGASRMSTELKVLIIVEEQITLRVPTREDSKDWVWRGRKAAADSHADLRKKKSHIKLKKGKHAGQDLTVRPFGWIDLTVAKDSTVRFNVDMVAMSDGYHNNFELDLKEMQLSSSVNHAVFWKSPSQSLSCDLSNPLAWRAMRRWSIEFLNRGSEFFLLRDHMFLVTDLINDWASGPPPDFYTFVPFEYNLNLQFSDIRLNLNANDSNVIDNPVEFDKNTFVIFWAQEFFADLRIPMQEYRPSKNKVCFSAKARDGGLDLNVPLWNTQSTFLASKDIAVLKTLELCGSYNYFTSTSAALTDILLMDIYGSGLKVQLFGFLIRYLMNIKDNYFGDDIHFRTLEEYQRHVEEHRGSDIGNDVSFEHHKRPTNDLDTILTIRTEKSCALLPAQLYSGQKGVKLELFSATADLRITNYYMDVAVSTSPLSISLGGGNVKTEGSMDIASEIQTVVEYVDISGHRLFGLPPDEPTYMCKWDFAVGTIKGECSIEFLRSAILAVRCFKLSLKDRENAINPIPHLAIHDATFLQARVEAVMMALRVENYVVLLTSQTISINFDDWASPSFSNQMSALIPELSVAVVEPHGRLGPRASAISPSKTYACLKTTLQINTSDREHHHEHKFRLQQDHIALHDLRTKRTPWLIFAETLQPVANAALKTRVRTPAMIYPPMPPPIPATMINRTRDSSKNLPNEPDPSDGDGTSSMRDKEQPGVTNRKNTNVHYVESVVGQQTRTGRHEPQSIASPLLRSTTGQANILGSDERNKASSLSFGRENISFSSPFKRPHFPLLDIIPDTTSLPEATERLAADDDAIDSALIRDATSKMESLESKQTHCMIELKNGLRVMCTPNALDLLICIQGRLQEYELSSVMDNLQVDVTEAIASTKHTHDRPPFCMDFRLFVPFLGLKFLDVPEERSTAVLHHEQYEVSGQDLRLVTRLLSHNSDDSDNTSGVNVSAHLLVNSVTASAKESAQVNGAPQAIISLKAHDPTLWFQLGPQRIVEASIDALETVSAGRKAVHVTSLVHQSTILVHNASQRFISNTEKNEKVLQRFIRKLTESGRPDVDPPFLRGASYLLRSAKGHIRQNDSWWMLMHLRYALMSLPDDKKHLLSIEFCHSPSDFQPNALHRTASYFKHANCLDPGQVESTLFIQKVYRSEHSINTSRSTQQVSSRARLYIRRFGLIFDPGIEQNEIIVDRCMIGVDSHPIASKTNSGQEILWDTTISMSVGNLSIRVIWSLLEHIENIVETARASQLSGFKSVGNPAPPQSPTHSQYHFMVSSEAASLSLRAINFRAITVGRGLKLSFISHTGAHNQKYISESLTAAAFAFRTELHGHGSTISNHKLHTPYVFACRDRTRHSRTPKPWKITCHGDTMALQLHKTPLEICELIDDCIQDEVTHLLHLTSRLNTPSATPLQRYGPVKNPAPKIHAVLLLGSYCLTFPLFPALLYEILGEGLQASIQSAVAPETAVKAIIDIRGHSHRFRASNSEKSEIISTLQIPRVNGSLTFGRTAQYRVFKCRTYTNPIDLSASSLHAIFTALNQPALIKLGQGLKQESELIRSHMDHVIAKIARPNDIEPAKPTQVLFDIASVVNRLVIHAATPTMPGTGDAFLMNMDFGLIRMHSTNIDSEKGLSEGRPNLHLWLTTIGFNFLRAGDLGHVDCGNLSLGLEITGSSRINEAKETILASKAKCNKLDINLYTETASAVVAVMTHLNQTLKTIELPPEIRGLRKAGRQRLQREGILPTPARDTEGERSNAGPKITFSLVMSQIRVAWSIGNAVAFAPGREAEDLILSFRKIDLTTREGRTARLLVQDFQLQMAPPSHPGGIRSSNSALLPEVIFNVAYKGRDEDMRLAFHAVGKTFDLQLTSQSILPANDLRRSIAMAVEQLRTASSNWRSSEGISASSKTPLLSNSKLSSLLVYADFAGAVVHIQGKTSREPRSTVAGVLKSSRSPQHGKYNQFISDQSTASSATLRSPGIALNVEFKNSGRGDKSLGAEMQVSASSNTLYPSVVPLAMEISSSIREIIGESEQSVKSPNRTESKSLQTRFLENEELRSGDPSTLLGGCKVNLGLRICRQDFSLSCQPVARVAARARFEDIYFTINTVQSAPFGKFFTITAAFTGLEAFVQHVYSRESTADVKIDSIVISFLNSKHFTAVNGISAIMKVSPVKAQVNAKQMQDFLLFRDIWIPPEMRQSQAGPQEPPAPTTSQNFVIQRYQLIAATETFPWNAVISIAGIILQLDFGSAIGRPSLEISNFWVSSQKSSDWEQNMCTSLDKVIITCAGRMNGVVELQNLKIRNLIHWADAQKSPEQTPRVQASARLERLTLKIGFDFQSFLIMNISAFEFLMYNVIHVKGEDPDRLVSLLEGDQVQAFCTATSASQAYSLIQAFQRLIEEKQRAYEDSLREIETFLRRKSTARPGVGRSPSSRQSIPVTSPSAKPPFRLQTDVVVSLRAVSLGVFPGSFTDNQIFKIEALETSARFAVSIGNAKIHSTLSMALGSLKVALSATDRYASLKRSSDLSVHEVLVSAATSSGGTILKVPRLIAVMETWQGIGSSHIDYIFKSEFQGRVDVGWNYSRVSYIRGMYANHTRTLAQRLGKPLPQSAVQITGLEKEEGKVDFGNDGQDKITAVVNVPQSKYEYTALRPPIIETPQLRDMGEATPPLEWIGLHRERLPTLTHQVVIVALLEVAQEVDNAYSRILGAS